MIVTLLSRFVEILSMNKLAGLLIILAFSKATFAEPPNNQAINANNRLESAMELDPLVPLVLIQEMGQALKSSCIDLYPEHREEIKFSYARWSPSQSKVEVYLDGKRVYPYRKLRAMAEEKIGVLINARNSGTEKLCRQIDLIMVKLSAELMPSNYFDRLRSALE